LNLMWIDLQGGRTQDIIQAWAVIGDFNKRDNTNTMAP